MRDEYLDEYLKVGELARRTGVSVRALHHYDALGLLKPALGGAGEARLYGPAEVARLLRIRSLQRLGLALDEIRACLDDPAADPLAIVERHLARVEEELELGRRLRDRLEVIARSLRAAAEPAVDDLLQTIELMSEMDFTKYYGPEQMEYLARRRGEVGEERMRAVQGEWQELFEAFRAARARGDDPSSEPVRALARRAAALIEEFTGGDPGIRESLGRLHAENPGVRAQWGVEPELWEYMGRARASLGDG